MEARLGALAARLDELLGYIHYEYEKRRHPVWFKDGRLALEDLNRSAV